MRLLYVCVSLCLLVWPSVTQLPCCLPACQSFDMCIMMSTICYSWLSACFCICCPSVWLPEWLAFDVCVWLGCFICDWHLFAAPKEMKRGPTRVL